ncbi:MAG: hypothetical protein LBT40_18750 [Deltaproteobacteria bacterium]|jgi:hypothetical protein|nr:hypothetical protein [Deltaproteobacteria bacterium]
MLTKDLGIEVHRFKDFSEDMIESIRRNAPVIAAEHGLRFPSVDIYGKMLKTIERQIAVLYRTLENIRTDKTTRPNRRNHWPR